MNSGIINPDYAAQKFIDISVENDENLCGVLIDLNKNILLVKLFFLKKC